jgi:DeoR family transcriptional regulator, suf operon transcriptional repressor
MTPAAAKSRQLILDLVRQGPVRIAELAASTGLSVNAVRFHLESLEAEGLVAVAGTQPPTGPGKPAALYVVTAEADLEFSRAYAPVLAACISELRSSVPPKQVIPFLNRVGKRVGSSASVRGKPLATRVRAASDFLNALGGVTTVTKTKSGYRIEGKGCPLAAVVELEPCTCTAVESVVTEIVGKKMVERCDRSGRPSCCFELSA